MANVKNNTASQDTRRRLLEAAGQVFAERGFHLATIKDITDRAGASVAAVNYHFQDKAELYAAVLRKLAEERTDVVPPNGDPGADAATKLRHFVHFICGRMIAREKPLWEQVLIARELAEPTAALEPLHQTVIGPLTTRLSAIIAELLGASSDDEAVGLAAGSVFAQCVYYVKHQNLVGRMHPQLGERPDADRLAEHIEMFSLAGIRAQRVRLTGKAKPPAKSGTGHNTTRHSATRRNGTTANRPATAGSGRQRSKKLSAAS
jgi:AcrR family transcriptional regulator